MCEWHMGVFVLQKSEKHAVVLSKDVDEIVLFFVI